MNPAKRATRVVLVTSVMLSFISFWRAAASVLNDLGSSAYCVGVLPSIAVGRAALYIELCGMFTRGGVCRVVKEP